MKRVVPILSVLGGIAFALLVFESFAKIVSGNAHKTIVVLLIYFISALSFIFAASSIKVQNVALKFSLPSVIVTSVLVSLLFGGAAALLAIPLHLALAIAIRLLKKKIF